MSKKEMNLLQAQSPVGKIFDFSERLSPMLVKELRQGLRSVSFTGLFLTIQAILLLFIVLTIAVDGAEPESLSFAIFFIFGVCVCGIQPLRGINAISSEIKGDTIDLIVLTRLSAWKIVYGKWVSLMGQTLIVTISLLPYLILRYFLGGMQLLEELSIFYSIFIIGALTTAISVGLSSLHSIVLRFILGLGISFGFTIIFFSILVRAFFQSLSRSGGIEPEHLFYGLASLTVVGIYLSWTMLDFGTTMIAPLSENRATARRFAYIAISTIGCAILLLMDTSAALFPTEVIVRILLLMLFVPFFITTVTEKPYLTPRVCRNFLENKWLKPVRYVLYPGWSTGYLFLFLCLIGHLILAFTFESPFGGDESFTAVICISLACLVFPAALMAIFAQKMKSMLTFYLITLIVSFLLTAIISIISGPFAGESGVATLFFWNPPTMFYLLGRGTFEATTATAMSLAIIVVGSIIIFIRSSNVFAHIRYQENYAKQALQRPEEIEKR